MMPTGYRYTTSCDYLHLFFDDTENNSDNRHLIKIEWFYYSQDKIFTTNNFGYKRDPGRHKYGMKMESDKVFYNKDGEIRPKLTAMKWHKIQN